MKVCTDRGIFLSVSSIYLISIYNESNSLKRAGMHNTILRLNGMLGFLLLVCAMVSDDLAAEVYRWVDEDGKVHYGDSKPNDVGEDVLEISAQYDLGEDDVSPIAKPIGRQVHSVYIEIPNMPWADEPEKIYSVGNYYVGKSCGLLPTAMNWPAVNIDHSGLLASPVELAGSIQVALMGLSYPARVVYDQRGIESLNTMGGTLLKADILELDFDACSQTGEKRLLSGQFADLTSRAFKRHRAELKVRWQLMSHDEKTLLYESEFVGKANSWERDGFARETLIAALRSSFEKLMSDPEFAEYLGTQRVQTIGDDQTPFWEKLVPWKAYTQKARLSSVLNEFSQIKTLATEYYVNEGHWPDDSSSLLSPFLSDIADANEEIDELHVFKDGRIEALLSESFGVSRVISLVPEILSSSGSIRWSCQSNLSKELVPESMNCSHY